MLPINNVMGYLSLENNYKTAELFTKRNTFEIEIVVSTRLLWKQFYNNEKDWSKLAMKP